MSEITTINARRTRALILYQHGFLRDVVAKLLSSVDVDIVAVINPEDFSPLLLSALQPQVIVVEQAALDKIDGFARMALFNHQPDVPSRVVVISLLNTDLLVWRKQVIPDADAQKLRQAVCEAEATTPLPSPRP